MRALLPTLDDVRDALRRSADLASDRDREAFCAAVGIDYRNAAEYYGVVAGMERSLARTAATAERASAASTALDGDWATWPPIASLADFVYRTLVFALQVLVCDEPSRL